MKRNLMIFKRHPEDIEIADAPRDSGVVFYSHENGNFYIASKAETSYQRSDALCIANKQDVFSCLTDEEIDAEYRKRLIGKDVLFADIPVGSYVMALGLIGKVSLSCGPEADHGKVVEFQGEALALRAEYVLRVCEPPEQKKNEELSDLIKSMEEMIKTAKKHLECEE